VTTDLSNAKWFKSTKSGAAGHCVEVASLDGGQVAVRNSNDLSMAPLVYTADEWTAFIAGVQDGEFDNL
jgi:hypothetical protein